MHDVKWIRGNGEAFDRGLARRGLPALSPRIAELDGDNRRAATEIQELRTRRKDLSARIHTYCSYMIYKITHYM